MTRPTSSKLVNARRDAIVLVVLITAVMLLIWNGSAFFHHLPMADANFGPGIRLASVALTLNVALILFGWRRYVDLQHEAEMRAEHERRALAWCWVAGSGLSRTSCPARSRFRMPRFPAGRRLPRSGMPGSLS